MNISYAITMEKMWEKILLYFLCGAFILISDDTFLFGTSGISELKTVEYSFLVILPLFLYIVKRSHLKYNRAQLGLLLLVIVCIILSSVINGNSFVGGPLLLLSLILSSSFFVRAYSLRQFGQCFCNIVLFLTGYSLIVWVLVSLGFISTNIVFNIADTPVNTFGGNMLFHSSGSIFRNSSIFREPGVFMIYINLAFLIDALYLHNNRTTRLIIYFFGILSSFSTAGIIIFLLLLLTFFLGFKRSVISYLMIALVSLLIIPIMRSEEYNEETFSKLEMGMDSNSTFARVVSVTVPFEMFLENPLFGVGLKNYQTLYLDKLSTNYLTDRESSGTNTIMIALAVWGAFIGLYLLLGIVFFSKIVGNRKKWEWVFVALAIVLMLSNESILYSLTLHLCLVYGWSIRFQNK